MDGMKIVSASYLSTVRSQVKYFFGESSGNVKSNSYSTIGPSKRFTYQVFSILLSSYCIEVRIGISNSKDMHKWLCIICMFDPCTQPMQMSLSLYSDIHWLKDVY